MRGAHLYCGLSSGKHGKYAVASLRNRAGILQNTLHISYGSGLGLHASSCQGGAVVTWCMN
jgi:hypothetical protein